MEHYVGMDLRSNLNIRGNKLLFKGQKKNILFLSLLGDRKIIKLGEIKGDFFRF